MFPWPQLVACSSVMWGGELNLHEGGFGESVSTGSTSAFSWEEDGERGQQHTFPRPVTLPPPCRWEDRGHWVFQMDLWGSCVLMMSVEPIA
jgi:hypothetical protein